MKSNDLITVEKAIQIASFCHGAGIARGLHISQKGTIPDLSNLYLFSTLGVVFDILEIAEMEDTFEWILVDKPDIDKVARELKDSLEDKTEKAVRVLNEKLNEIFG